MKKTLIAAFALVSTLCSAEIAIIAHPAAADVSLEEVSRIYMGRAGSLMPVNLPENHALRDQFEQEALGRSPAQMKAYWSRLVFTGKGRPPVEVDSVAAKIEFVAANPNSLGYIPASDVTDQVRVIATIAN
ncbi:MULTISPECIES: type 2 periplasmic-binding domain-containing protein [Alkalimonas]|uniref:Phosphate ABC transporter substrate-binding protein n=1 Tax=Alkalimonas mucilaginosa TaxID=3057676 RepID=A0ABU7JLL2_9GAMM|nr:phosphate ABC transporter substrate-binding protein [Alkalimonas sp. MEB004]MEE2025853.1 phosphate ABC transporter substrate-binding protein [Alkalimonas sp. MEB004]